MNATQPSVLAAFRAFSRPLEGYALNPYPDTKNLITVAIGCLIDPFSLALTVKWTLPDGSIAPDAEVVRQLSALKALDLRRYAFDSPSVLAATTIRLSPEQCDALVAQRMLAIEPWMLRYFPAFASWPADAQLFAYSIAWAEGAGWPALNPNLTRILKLDPPQFGAAIVHAPDSAHPGHYLPAAADINATGNPGIVPRNAQNALALSNAQLVQTFGLDRSVLHWPKSPLTDGTLQA